MNDIKQYVPEFDEPSGVLYEMPVEERQYHGLVGLHNRLMELRDQYDFSEPESVKFSCDIPLVKNPAMEKFNDMMCSSVSVKEWCAETLECPGVFPDCCVIDLSKYGTLPFALYEVLKSCSSSTVKDVLVGLPVFVLETID